MINYIKRKIYNTERSAYVNLLAIVLAVVSVFSFFGNKTITTGEGGMVVAVRQVVGDNCGFFLWRGVCDESNFLS